MSTEKVTKKKLKEPDAFQIWFSQFADFLLQNQKKVILASLTVVAIALIGVGLNYWGDYRVKERRQALAIIEKERQNELEKVEDQKKVLENQIEKMAAEGEDAKDKAQKSEADENKVKALRDQLASITPDHASSNDKFMNFYLAHKGSPEGWAAGIRHASNLIKNKKFVEAEGVFQQIFGRSKDYPMYQIVSGLSLVGLLEDRKQFDEALKVVEALLKIVPKDLQPRVLLSKARIHYFNQKTADAKTILDKIIDEGGSPGEIQKARSMKGLLN